MNHKPQNRSLERFTYSAGQKLRSRDFLEIQRVEEQHRWWHNRAMHNAFGVYRGFEPVIEKDASGKPVVLEIRPGLAYDCMGRELILECPALIPYPPRPPLGETITLLVRYKKPASRSETDPVSSVCCFSGGSGSAGTVEFVWVSGARRSPTEGVPLGSLRNTGSTRDFFSATPLPRKRALARPHLATGSTVPGSTSWQPWEFASPVALIAEDDGLPPIEIGVQTTIDTSAAGFTELPQYFAWLEGPIFIPKTQQLVPALLPSLTNESLAGFTFRLVLMKNEQPGVVEVFAASPVPPIELIESAADFADFALRNGLYVSWLGCQMPARTETAPEATAPCTRNFTAIYERGIR